MNKTRGIIIAVVAVLAFAGLYTLLNLRNNATPNVGNPTQAPAAAQGDTITNTIRIRPATDRDQVSAAGNIALRDTQPIVPEQDGRVTEVLVELADIVSAGQELARLDTTTLEKAVRQAELVVADRQLNLDRLMESPNDIDVAQAEANLVSAQENLAQLQQGADQADIEAAELRVAAAWNRYADLADGPSAAELTQRSAEMKRAELALADAQSNYDAVAWDSRAATAAGLQLQDATITYEAAKAGYEQAINQVTQADLQDALLNARQAENDLANLQEGPNNAELAAAEAQLIQAQAALDNLTREPNANDIRAAEIALAQAELDLETAQQNLAQASIVAPISGAIIALSVEEGQRVSPNQAIGEMAEIGDLKLDVAVAEVDVSRIYEGQAVEISIDALPDQAFEGVVEQISPLSDNSNGVVNYPVVIAVPVDPTSGVRVGMTAIATMLEQSESQRWLVPSNAIREEGGEQVVLVMRGDEPVPVPVTPGPVQGEWTIVASDELQAEDEVVGTVSSFLTDENPFMQGGPPGR